MRFIQRVDLRRFALAVLLVAGLILPSGFAYAGMYADVVKNVNLAQQQGILEKNCDNYEGRGGQFRCNCTLMAEGEKMSWDFCAFKKKEDYGNMLFLSGNLFLLYNLTGFGDNRITLRLDPLKHQCELLVGAGLQTKFQASASCQITEKRADGCLCQPLLAGKNEVTQNKPSIVDFAKNIFLPDDYKLTPDRAKDLQDAIKGFDLVNRVCPVLRSSYLATYRILWDCSKPVYKDADRCCCAGEEKGLYSTTYSNCERRTGFEDGGKCKQDEKLFPVPKTPSGPSSCESLKRQGEAPPVSGVEGPGISAEFLLGRARDELNPLKQISGPQEVIGRGILFLMSFIGSIALVLYIYAGILWMTASGNTEQITKAKQVLIWTTLGLAVMLGSYVIVRALFGGVIGLPGFPAGI